MRARIFGSMWLAVASPTPDVSFAQTAPDSRRIEKGPNNESLSEKLDKRKGVLAPKPGVNDPIVKPSPAPNADPMPVIPPKGPGTQAK